MKAKKYTRSAMIDHTHGWKAMIEEIYVPKANIGINGYGVFRYDKTIFKQAKKIKIIDIDDNLVKKAVSCVECKEMFEDLQDQVVKGVFTKKQSRMKIDYILDCSECPYVNTEMNENSIQWNLGRLHKPYRFCIEWHGDKFELIEKGWQFFHCCSALQMADNPRCPKPFVEKVQPEIKIDWADLTVVTDVSQIQKCLKKVIEENPQAVQALQKGKIKTIDFFIGKIMKQLNQRGDVKTIKDVIMRHFDIRE